MSGQVSQFGSEAALNHIVGQSQIVVGSSPPTWYPGVSWVNTGAGNAVYIWNGTSWVSGTYGARWLALLTADPVAGGVVNLSDAGFLEMTTAGYSRQSVTFSTAAATYPSSSSNTNLITFGPMSASMTAAIQWVALVTVSSGTAGIFLFSWALPAPIQVQASQNIQISPGTLVIGEA